MHIVYFFTYGYSLESWESAGILDREIRIFHELIKKYNLKFTFITYGDKSDLKFNLGKNINIIPIYTLRKKSNSKFINLIKSFFLSKVIFRKINKLNIIKQNQLMGSWVSILFKLKYKKPLYIRTGYDMFLFSLKDQKSIFKILLYYLLTQFTFLFSDLYTVTSASDYKFLNRFFIFKRKKLAIRYNWVESNNYKNLSDRSSKEILSVGRLEKQKNYQHLIKSIAETDFTLHIVGEGKEREIIESLAKKLSVNIKFLGILNNKELMNLYSNYKYFISTSNFEGNPKALLEAMSSGCIVIARDIPNNREIINDHHNGILFNDDNINLNELLKNIKNIGNIENLSLNATKHTKLNNSIEKLSELIYLDFVSLNKPK